VDFDVSTELDSVSYMNSARSGKRTPAGQGRNRRGETHAPRGGEGVEREVRRNSGKLPDMRYLIVFLLAGCATAGDYWELPRPEDPKWETILGEQILRLHKTDGGWDSISRYQARNILRAQQTLEPITGLKPVIVLLASNDINAFSSPGRVVLTLELVRSIGNDFDAITLAMAHEIAHLKLGHSIEQQKAAGVSFSREQEHAADALALEWAKQAKLDPCGLARTMAAVRRFQIPLLSTHPGFDDRIKTASKIAGRECE
jgi:hypothetical protein